MTQDGIETDLPVEFQFGHMTTPATPMISKSRPGFLVHGKNPSTGFSRTAIVQLLKKVARQGNLSTVMSRLFVATCCLLVIVAGAFAAWANCSRVSFGNDLLGYSDPVKHAHDHGTDAHEQSSRGQIHCPIVKDFLPGAMIFANPSQGPGNASADILAISGQSSIPIDSFGSIHDPPALQSDSIPYRILFSSFRI